MKILLILLFAPLIALALMYFVFPGRLVALGRTLLRQRLRHLPRRRHPPWWLLHPHRRHRRRLHHRLLPRCGEPTG